MVFVCSGSLSQEGARYRVYLNQDNHNEQRFYLRVTHILRNGSRNFRAGTYKSKEDALEALKKIDPEHPKRLKTKVGSVDLYSNGSWRVRAKYNGEVLHIGYFKTKEEADVKLKKVINDQEFLQQRYENLLKKRIERKARNRARSNDYLTQDVKRRKVDSVPQQGSAYGLQFDPLTIKREPFTMNTQTYPMLPESAMLDFTQKPFQSKFYHQNHINIPSVNNLLEKSWSPPHYLPLSPPCFLDNENMYGLSPLQSSYAPRTENRVLSIEIDDTPSQILVPNYVNTISYDQLKVLILSQDRDLYFNLVSRDLHFVHGKEIKLAETLFVDFADLPLTIKFF